MGGQDGQLSDEHTSLSLSFFSSEALRPLQVLVVIWNWLSFAIDPQNIFLCIGEWEEELINTHTRALAFNFFLVPPSYSASSLVKRAGLVWFGVQTICRTRKWQFYQCSVLTLWFDQYVFMEGEKGWGFYFFVYIILCISLKILNQDEHFDDQQCVHLCDKNVSNMPSHKSQPP